MKTNDHEYGNTAAMGGQDVLQDAVSPQELVALAGFDGSPGLVGKDFLTMPPKRRAVILRACADVVTSSSTRETVPRAAAVFLAGICAENTRAPLSPLEGLVIKR